MNSNAPPSMLYIQSCDLLCSGNWGPHLIIVPTSVMLNWEMELKRWCPGFKILTYFGSQKERKLKRQVMSSLMSFSFSLERFVFLKSQFNQYCLFFFFVFFRAGLSPMLSMCASPHTSWCCRITRPSDASLGGT